MIEATACNAGSLGSRKSVNIPGVEINLPSLTPRDIINIGYAIDLGVDFIAHSFVRSARDVLDIQAILDARNSPIKIISKIENQQGIDNFDEILKVSYGIMVARGDLGIEIPAEKIPAVQKRMINRCITAHKPVIVATQMLHSMISNPRPTRAEISDIAGAVYQHTDALMLSGETAYGKYPVEAISTMNRVAMEVERSLSYSTDDEAKPYLENDVTAFLAQQAVTSCRALGTRAILTDSFTAVQPDTYPRSADTIPRSPSATAKTSSDCLPSATAYSQSTRQPAKARANTSAVPSPRSSRRDFSQPTSA